MVDLNVVIKAPYKEKNVEGNLIVPFVEKVSHMSVLTPGLGRAGETEFGMASAICHGPRQQTARSPSNQSDGIVGSALEPSGVALTRVASLGDDPWETMLQIRSSQHWCSQSRP